MMENDLSGEKKGTPEWIPMRISGKVAPFREEYGNVSWLPNFILYADRLQINVTQYNRLAQMAGLHFPIEIRPFNAPQDNQIPFITGKQSALGEATWTKVINKIKKPKMAERYLDRETNRMVMGVNFSGAAQLLEDTLAEGRNNSRFFEEYGAIINNVLKNNFWLAAVINYDERGGMYELANTIASAISAIPLGYLLQMLETAITAPVLDLTKLDFPQYSFLFYAVTYELLYMYYNGVITSGENKTKYMELYCEYIRERLKQKDLTSIMIQKQTLNQLVAPSLLAALSRENLIRGR